MGQRITQTSEVKGVNRTHKYRYAHIKINPNFTIKPPHMHDKVRAMSLRGGAAAEFTFYLGSRKVLL